MRAYNFNQDSPPPVLSRIGLEEKEILVLRDDLLPGGTKQRAAVPYIQILKDRGFNHFVYASPFSGFAQVALAIACSKLQVACTLLCERDSAGSMHEFTRLARAYGAKIKLCDGLSEASERATQMSVNASRTMTIPLGFNDEDFRGILHREVQMLWQKMTEFSDISEVWLPVGSGTLLGTVKQVVGDQVRIFGVNVNVLPETDARIASIKSDARIHYIRSQQEFHDPCQGEVPVPSNLYYDSKLFEHLEHRAQAGALWWNVAR